MKKITLQSVSILMLTTILLMQSCKKKSDAPAGPPKTYAEIKQDAIKNKEAAMSANAIQASGSGGVSWSAGDVFVYKTRTGLYGKFKILSITVADNYKLVIEAVTFNAAGAIHKQTASLTLPGTWVCDLETLVESTGGSDFHWNRQNSTDTFLEPENGAKFVKYVF